MTMNDLDLPFADTAQPGPGGRPGRHRHKRSRGGRTFVAFLVIIVVFGAIAGGGWYGYNKAKDFFAVPDYSGQGTTEVIVAIEQGDTSSDIANTLYEADVIKSAKAFVEVAKTDSRALSLQPGSYRVRKQMSAAAALDMLLDPSNKNVKQFTIPEGLTVKEILPKIAEGTGIKLADLETAAKDPAGLGVPDWARAKASDPLVLEGFLFPNTYAVNPDQDAKAVLSMMVAEAVKVMTEDQYAQAAQKLGVTQWELLMVASLVEQEGVAADFGKVARVVYNRLERTDYLKYLQFDSTTQYWLIQTTGKRKPLLTNDELMNPANNYSTAIDQHAGLPPTPISNPGKAALDAAANPEEGPWTYFVVTSEDGKSSFTDSLDEHNRNVQKCEAIGRC